MKSDRITIDNPDAQAFVKKLFERIKKSKTTDDLKEIPSEIGYKNQLEKNMPGREFPRLHLRITKDEINALKEVGALSENMQLSHNLANGEMASGIKLSTLEKLLYAVLWKNGDLGKEHHLVSGILRNGHAQRYGAVFYEFGGYLSGEHAYILDQHNLRCFAIAVAENSEEIAKARRLESINGMNKQHSDWRNAYAVFYAEISKTLEDVAKSDFLYEVDRLLFSAGRLTKLK